MPNSIIDRYSKTYNIPKNEVEKVWKQIDNKFRLPKPYGLIVKLFKNKMAKVIRERKESTKERDDKDDSTKSR